MSTHLSISIYFQTTPEGPGWYLLAQEQHGPELSDFEQVIPRVRLSAEEAVQLAKVLEKFAADKTLNPSESIKQSSRPLHEHVQDGNIEAKNIVQNELAKARKAAASIATLEARVAEFDTETPD